MESAGWTPPEDMEVKKRGGDRNPDREREVKAGSTRDTVDPKDIGRRTEL